MKRIPLLASLALLGLAACDQAPTDLDPVTLPEAEARADETLSGVSPLERAEPAASPWADVQIDATAPASPTPLILEGDVTLTFDDIPAGAGNDDVITDEYAADGVTWVTDDGVVRQGLSQGDPGNWGLEGTNGPQFLGFNGTSYTGTMVLSDNASQVTLDASRSNGSEDGDGLLDEDDLCAGTVVPDPVIPTQDLGRNRFALVDGDDTFDTNRPSPRAPERIYTLEDTGGCNAGQIADALGVGQSEYRFGLTVGTMERWLRMVAMAAAAP